MAFLRMSEIETLPTPERIYLAHLEQALDGFVARIPATLAGDVVDGELIARAAVTVFLVIAARSADNVGKKQNIAISRREFGRLAEDALRWVRNLPGTLN
jgi:hypothetical protein